MQGETLLFRDHSAIRPISIHSPHAGRDVKGISYEGGDMPFQSTLPMRGETVSELSTGVKIIISIHSPHAGRDCTGHIKR